MIFLLLLALLGQCQEAFEADLENVLDQIFESRKNWNREAFAQCAQKYYIETENNLAWYMIGFFQIFGFPEDSGDTFLQYCKEYGEYSVDELKFERNLTQAYITLSQAVEASHNALPFMIFISKLQALEDKSKLDIAVRDLAILRYSHQDFSRLAAFNHEYQCHSYHKHKQLNEDLTRVDILKLVGLINDTNINYLNQIYEQCSSCESVAQSGIQILFELYSLYEDQDSELQLTDEDLLIIEQRAQNEDEIAVLKKAYNHGIGNTELGIEPNLADSKALFEKVSHNPMAQANLGVIALKEEKYEEALKYFNASAKQGFHVGYEGLAFMYWHGQGVEPDFNKTIQYFEEAANLGSERAIIMLLILRANEDLENSVLKLLQRTNNIDALFGLLSIYQQTQGIGIPVSCDQILDLASKVAKRAYGKHFYKHLRARFGDQSDKSWKYYSDQFEIFIGTKETDRLEEQFLFGFKGAASKVAKLLQDRDDLAKELYRSDKENPEAYYQSSVLELKDNNYDQALAEIDELILQTLQGKHNLEHLLPAYLWKLRLYIAYYL